ncbi:MAG: hypothetical protein N2491_12200 [Negativicutes bacterium]|nr:hypothetical protein [Negativicutes bacterium]
MSYGQLIMFFILGLDAAGIAGQYWIYPIKLLPVIPHEVAIDCGLLPVLHMLIYQYFRQWKTFLLAEVIAAAILAFGGEIFAEMIGVYLILKWQHIWSVPIYTAKAIVARLIIDSLLYNKSRQ